MLSGALAFAAIMGSPYEVLRDSVLDALTVRNVTMEGNLSVELNGEILELNRIHSVYGDESYLNWIFDEQGNPTTFSFGNGYFHFNNFNTIRDVDGVEWYRASLNRHQNFNWMRGSDLQMFTQEDLDSAEMRFALLVMDALVGDIRNNITMSSSGGLRTIRGSLTEHQIPELVRAGIDLMIEQSNQFGSSYWTSYFDGSYVVEERTFRNGDMMTVSTSRTPARRLTADEQQMWNDGTFWNEIHRMDHFGTSWVSNEDYPLINTGQTEHVDESNVPVTREHFERFSDPLDFPLRNLTINHVRGEAIVDSDGNLLDIDFNAGITITSIFDDINSLEISFTAQFTDIGTSVPVSPIPNLEQILTHDNMYARFGHSPFEVYFTFNPDGTINMDSLTTTHPSEARITPEDSFRHSNRSLLSVTESIVIIDEEVEYEYIIEDSPSQDEVEYEYITEESPSQDD
jgi:hypothetical protein